MFFFHLPFFLLNCIPFLTVYDKLIPKIKNKKNCNKKRRIQMYYNNKIMVCVCNTFISTTFQNSLKC